MIRSLLVFLLMYIPAQAALAENASVSPVSFARCEQVIKEGVQLANTSSSYEDTSYWIHGDRYFRLRISSVNLFNVTFECDELSLPR